MTRTPKQCLVGLCQRTPNDASAATLESAARAVDAQLPLAFVNNCDQVGAAALASKYSDRTAEATAVMAGCCGGWTSRSEHQIFQATASVRVATRMM